MNDDCSIIELAEEIQRVATMRAITEVQPPDTQYYDATTAEVLAVLNEQYPGGTSSGKINELDDGRVELNPGTNSGYTIYYPKGSAAVKDIYDSFDWIVERFQYFEDYSERPSLDSRITQLADLNAKFDVGAALARLSEINPDVEVPPDISNANDWSDLPNSATYLEGWKGEGAKTFTTNYVNRFDYYLAGQSGLIAILHESLAIASAAYHAGYQDAWAIAEATITELGGDYDVDIDLEDVLTVLQAVSAVASIAAAVPTGGASFGFTAAMGMASGGTSLAATVVGIVTAEKEPEPLRVSGVDTTSILSSMKSALSTVKTSIIDVEQSTATWLGDFGDSLYVPSEWSPYPGNGEPVSVLKAYFEPMQPALADLGSEHGDGGSSDDEVLDDTFDSDYLGTTSSGNEGQVASDFKNLRSAADLISRATVDYSGFASQLEVAGEGAEEGFSEEAQAGDTGDSYVSAGYSSKMLFVQWNYLYDTTQSIFSESAENLEAISTGLNLAADAYESMDWSNSEKLWIAGND